MLVLGVLWWSWAAYAWLTSVVDPEEGAVRFAMFAAMAGFLIAAIAVPDAFGDLALPFALAYGAVRAAHIALFVLASRDDPGLRHSVAGLAVSSAIGVGLLVGASFLDGIAQGALWILALTLDMAGPLFFIDAGGWRLEPGHFAERHGLIIIIALGESIVAIGVGAHAHLTWGIAAAATLGVALSAALWWMYFDIVALVSRRRLINAPEGLVRNTLARDSYSYIHLPMVAGIVLDRPGPEDHTRPRGRLAGDRSPRSPYWAACPYTCSASWRFASATCTPSTASGSRWPPWCSSCSRWPRTPPPSSPSRSSRWPSPRSSPMRPGATARVAAACATRTSSPESHTT